MIEQTSASGVARRFDTMPTVTLPEQHRTEMTDFLARMAGE